MNKEVWKSTEENNQILISSTGRVFSIEKMAYLTPYITFDNKLVSIPTLIENAGFSTPVDSKVDNTQSFKYVKSQNRLPKPVLQYNLQGRLLHEWPSESAAARAVNGYQSNISYCCNGYGKTYRGFIWKFKTTA